MNISEGYVTCSVNCFLRVCFSLMCWFYVQRTCVQFFIILIMVWYFIDKQTVCEKEKKIQVTQLVALETGSSILEQFFFNFYSIHSFLINCASSSTAVNVLISASTFHVLKPFKIIILAFKGRERHAFAFLQIVVFFFFLILDLVCSFF